MIFVQYYIYILSFVSLSTQHWPLSKIANRSADAQGVRQWRASVASGGLLGAFANIVGATTYTVEMYAEAAASDGATKRYVSNNG